MSDSATNQRTETTDKESSVPNKDSVFEAATVRVIDFKKHKNREKFEADPERDANVRKSNKDTGDIVSQSCSGGEISISKLLKKSQSRKDTEIDQTTAKTRVGKQRIVRFKKVKRKRAVTSDESSESERDQRTKVGDNFSDVRLLPDSYSNKSKSKVSKKQWLRNKAVEDEGSSRAIKNVEKVSLSDSNEESHSGGVSDSCECDETTDVRIMPCQSTKTRRVWDKKHYCLYCGKPYGKMPRHLQQIHYEETEVAHFLSLPLKSTRRRLLIRKIVNEGDYTHNFEALKNKKGELVTYRRPSSKEVVDSSDYVPCECCLAFFKRVDLWKHRQNCTFKSLVESNKQGSRRRLQSRSALLMPITCDASEGLKKNVIAKMNQDEIARVICTDVVILQYGSRLYAKHGHQVHRRQFISQRIRELGRLLLALIDKAGKNVKLADYIHPTKFPQVIEAVHMVCGFNSETNSFQTPSLSLKLGHALKACAEIVEAQSLIGREKERQQEAVEFIKLCDIRWKWDVSTHALTDLSQRKFNKPQLIPLTEDLARLQKFLKENGNSMSKQLSECPNVDAWTNLCQILLCQTVLFNRRRAGETERITLSQYNCCAKTSADDVIAKSLTKLEKQLCQQTWRLEIPGKRGRKVPVLFSDEMKGKVDVLVSVREVVGVPSNNIYLFARPSLESHMRSTDCMRKLASDCGAARPELITTTKLRKHIATVSQILNLKDNELDVLANFMGHDIRVHREFYRLPENTVQVAKVSKILLAMEKGASQYKGKSLDEIDIDLNGK